MRSHTAASRLECFPLSFAEDVCVLHDVALWLALCLKVRRESVRTRSQADTRRREALRHTRAVYEELNGETTYHSRVSALAPEAS